MDGKDFKKITSPKKVYCLISTDAEMVDLYVSRFKEMINADEVNHGSVKSYGKLFNKTVLNVLYMPKVPETVFNKDDYIFIYTDSIDKRTSIYKNYKDQIIELNNDYTDYIMKNSSMSRVEAQELAKLNDLGIIKSKLTIYNTNKECYNGSNVGDLFSWVEAFIKGDELPQINDSPIPVMALLANNCATIIKIQENNTKGINSYILNKLSMLKDCKNGVELACIISDCFWLDCQVKKGLIHIDDTLKYLISKYYRRK